MSGWRSCIVLAALVTSVPAVADEPKAQDDYRPIFNGKNLDGWIVEGWGNYAQAQRKHGVWTVDEGKLVCQGHSWGFLRYEKKLADFTLRLQYRVAPECNSGIGLRGGILEGWNWRRAPSWVGYEMQILDDADKPPTKFSSGALYRYVAPKMNAARPAGQWNEVEIACHGPRIRITLNGKLIQDVDQTEHTAMREKPLAGYISLQDHGGRIEFRDIRLKTP